MTADQLFGQILRKRSFLCVGLDPDLSRIPASFLESEYPVFEFNKGIIDITHDYAVAYKPNSAFYECLGESGWKQLQMTVGYIKSKDPDIFVIGDAKRGDIGNTAAKYAEAFFKMMSCDAITLSPYMGADSVKPFLEYKDKWAVLLALTSNQGAADFQTGTGNGNKPLFETVLEVSAHWGTIDNIMYVVGATRAEMLSRVREIVPSHFLLIPGVGAQGGDLQEVAAYGLNNRCGILVNASRSIIYAPGPDYKTAVLEQTLLLQKEMEKILTERLGV